MLTIRAGPLPGLGRRYSRHRAVNYLVMGKVDTWFRKPVGGARIARGLICNRASIGIDGFHKRRT